ncbi:hypothetical protein [Paenibacillus chitinolyticus]|uniref:hypothetical protein n=1 Tax=Paenibacillus chitinolyticus TaxID=79263 RepID=UPI003661A983
MMKFSLPKKIFKVNPKNVFQQNATLKKIIRSHSYYRNLKHKKAFTNLSAQQINDFTNFINMNSDLIKKISHSYSITTRDEWSEEFEWNEMYEDAVKLDQSHDSNE